MRYFKFKKHKPGSLGLCKFLSYVLILFLFSFYITSCGSDGVIPSTDPDPDPIVDTTGTASEVIILEESDIEDYDKFYKPKDFKNMDMLRSDSQWSFVRSKQSTHFTVFWEEGFGSDPNADTIPAAMRVDIDDLLQKAESFYDLNINDLKFAETGEGKSNLDKYKMMIFLFYQEEWLATGAGYDDVIGALWVSPNTCQPVGSVIAHEIGHTFQYQVFCDLGGASGFRYGFGGNGGNAFWEQTAQWQSFQSYPEQAFTSGNFGAYMQNYHRHICHEAQRYDSYWIHYYWADKHGIDIVGKIWREAQKPEDPIEAYMRITGITVEELNNEIYDAATKFVTWDLDAIRDIGAGYIGSHTFNSNRQEDGSYQVAYDRCPGTTGYNVIRLNVPEAGTVVTTEFTGMVNAEEYNQVSDPSRAGWRYGYVALLDDGTRMYGDMNQGADGSADFTVPANCSKLWFVVSGAPNTYQPHPWDDDNSNDDQWPYKVKFTNTDLYGTVIFDGTETPEDITFTYDISFPFDDTNYSGTTVELEDDMIDLAYAFVLQPGEITGAMDSEVLFYGVESNGALNANTTANGYGHWFDKDGNVISWGTEARVFSEYDASTFAFSIGQYPGQCAPGDQFTIKQALVYEYEAGQSVQATFVFNITIN